MSLPEPHNIQRENLNGEGVILFVTFMDETSLRDSSYIMIQESQMTKFSIDDWKCDSMIQKDGCTVEYGLKNGKHWRKDKRGRVYIYYDKVSSENKKMYDGILDSIRIVKQ